MRKILLLCPFLLLFTFCRSKKSVEADPHVSVVVENPKTDSIIPFVYFRFEEEDVFLQDEKKAFPCSFGNKNIRLMQAVQKQFPFHLFFQANISPAGNCLSSSIAKKEETITWPAATELPGKIQQLTVEFAVKFDPDSINTLQLGFVPAQFIISPEQIQIATLDTSEKTISIPLDQGLMRGTNEYIWDGNWHHIAFKFTGENETESGILQIFIDGKTNGFLKRKVKTNSIEAGPKFTFDFRGEPASSKNYLDELQIFTTEIPDAMIVKHSKNFFSGMHYDNTISVTDNKNYPFEKFPIRKDTIDPKDFAPGYPDYSVSQTDQLKTFPLPRFKTNTSLRRNFPWYDLMYMSYDYSKVVTTADGKLKYPQMKDGIAGERALKLNQEMYTHWNYYFNIPSPTYNWNLYADPKTIAGAQALYANQHPEIAISSIVFWAGIKPTTAGYANKVPFVTIDANINPCSADSTFKNIVKDGLVQRKNIEALLKVLPDRDKNRKIDFLNENGEVFGDSKMPNAEGYKGNKMISCIQQNPLTARSDRAEWQYKVFSTYSGQFVGNEKVPGLMNTSFSFYQIAGFMPAYYSEFSEMRKINSKFRGDYYSTPDFYPGHLGWEIWQTHGPYHGLDVIEEGRKSEIELGDNYFSPFICGGWFQDSLNFRPAEWLAATKALGMMGAEFYYPAFFDVGDPNTKIPVDPRGYIYQVAIPAYAQSVTSQYEDVLFHSADFVYRRNYNRILIYRRDTIGSGQRFAIFAGIFPNSNSVDASPESVSNNVKIGGEILKINFSRQGSTYIYDRSDPNHIVFYQLDSWQESSHPYYWSKDFLFEAEVHDDTTTVLLRTELPGNTAKNDFTDYTTFVSFSNAGITKKQLVYHFEPRNDTGIYYVWIRARTNIKNLGRSSYLKFQLDGNSEFALTGISSTTFRWYSYKLDGKSSYMWAAPGILHELRILAADPDLELDKILLSTTRIPVGIDVKEIGANPSK